MPTAAIVMSPSGPFAKLNIFRHAFAFSPGVPDFSAEASSFSTRATSLLSLFHEPTKKSIAFFRFFSSSVFSGRFSAESDSTSPEKTFSMVEMPCAHV